MRRLVAVLLGAVLAAVAFGREPSFEEYRTIQDSLHSMPMRMRSRWLAKHGIELPEWSNPEPVLTESGGLHMVGKWGRGPAVEVTGRDSLIFLALGSEVAIINVANPDSPQIVSEVQAQGLVANAAVKDSFLYIGCRLGTIGIEVWNIGNTAAPVYRGRAVTRLSDFCVQDSFAYVTLRVSDTSRDTFKVYNLSDPANPRLVGWIPDNGDKIAVSGNRVAIADWGDMHIMNIADPTHPQRMGSVGIDALGIDIRGNLVCAVKWWNGDDDDFWLDAFDISNPASPRLLSEIHGVGGYDIHLDGPLAFVSGFYYGWELQIVDISDSTHPALISTCDTPGWHDGVWADLTTNRVYVADYDRGLTVVDISNLNSPTVDTALLLAAGLAVDVSLCDTLMYVATWSGGMQIVNVADPTRPVSVGQYDSVGYHSWEATVVASDSFAYVGDFDLRPFRVLDVSDPRNPRLAGYPQGGFNPANGMVLRDSLMYCAEDTRFQVVNVSRPRQPVLAGSCVTSTYAYHMELVDTLAYIGGSPLKVINVARPAGPFVVGEFDRGSGGMDVVDTIMYVVGQNAQFWALSVAQPATPRVLDSLHLPSYDAADVVVVGSTAYACENVIRVVDVSDPAHLRLRGAASVPYYTWRLEYAAPYVYACCEDGGVCIFETTHVAIAEPKQDEGEQARKGASVVRGVLNLEVGSRQNTAYRAELLDIGGRKVLTLHPGANDVRALAPGVYFVREQPVASSQHSGPASVRKVVVAH